MNKVVGIAIIIISVFALFSCSSKQGAANQTNSTAYNVNNLYIKSAEKSSFKANSIGVSKMSVSNSTIQAENLAMSSKNDTVYIKLREFYYIAIASALFLLSLIILLFFYIHQSRKKLYNMLNKTQERIDSFFNDLAQTKDSLDKTTQSIFQEFTEALEYNTQIVFQDIQNLIKHIDSLHQGISETKEDLKNKTQSIFKEFDKITNYNENLHNRIDHLESQKNNLLDKLKRLENKNDKNNNKM